MDVSGSGGSDSFGKMIEGMKAPLNGMSVGFSSSLFGLMTSMVLGALERCMTSAMKTLRNEFEHWLSNLAQLESGQGETASSPSRDFGSVRRAIEAGAAGLAELRGVIIGLAHGAEANQAEIAGLTGAVGSLADVVAGLSDPRQIMRPVADAVAELAHNQSAMLVQLRALHEDAEADRAISAPRLRPLAFWPNAAPRSMATRSDLRALAARSRSPAKRSTRRDVWQPRARPLPPCPARRWAGPWAALRHGSVAHPAHGAAPAGRGPAPAPRMAGSPAANRRGCASLAPGSTGGWNGWRLPRRTTGMPWRGSMRAAPNTAPRSRRSPPRSKARRAKPKSASAMRAPRWSVCAGRLGMRFEEPRPEEVGLSDAAPDAAATPTTKRGAM